LDESPNEHSLNEERKRAINRLEETNRITKYQLVFVKIQSAISKLCLLVKNKELMKLQKGFNKFKVNVDKTEKLKAKSVITKLQTALESIIKVKERLDGNLLSKYVYRWRNAVSRYKLLKSVKKKLTSLEENQKKELIIKNHRISSLKQELEQHNLEVEKLKDQQTNLRLRLKLKEGRLQVKMRSPEQVTKGSEESIQALETRLKRLENENHDLREKLNSAEVNVEDFIQGVTEILDSHEFVSKLHILSLELKLEEFDTNENQDEEGTTEGYLKNKGAKRKNVGKTGSKKPSKYKSKLLFSSN